MKTYIGIDWSQTKHNVAVYNEQGAAIICKEVAHSRRGFEQMRASIEKVNPIPENCYVLIETDHNQVMDFLWTCNYQLHVIAPSVVKSNRGRQTSSGARNDDTDAALLADIMRTDQDRLIRWKPDSEPVRQLRLQCGLVDDLTASIIRYRNRLDALLRRYYSQPKAAFKDLTVPTWLNWLEKYPSSAHLATVTEDEFIQFCKSNGYHHTVQIAKTWARLREPAPLTIEPMSASYEIQHVARLLKNLVEEKGQLLTQIATTSSAHEDVFIFRSLPGAGNLLSAKMLAMLGDHRERWPSPASVRAVAGTCPATSQSGKKKVVFFRRACNYGHRATMQQFALQSVKQSDWAATYFARAVARGHSKSHAHRCLANRWLGVIWTLWQQRIAYDEAVHMRHVSARRQR